MYDVNYIILIVIFLISICQGVFGVGILVIGTPTLILLGYPFLDILQLLLPISVLVSLLQILELRHFIRVNWLSKNLALSLIGVIVGLIYANNHDKSTILIVISIIYLSLIFRLYGFNINMVNKLRSSGITYLLLGVFHGYTNLGGSLLPVIVEDQDNKNTKICNIAIIYLLFALVQLIVLFSIKHESINPDLLNPIFIFVGIFGSRYLGPKIRQHIRDSRYTYFVDVYLVVISISLIIKYYIS